MFQQSNPTPRDFGGESTGKSMANAFVTIQTAGIRELAKKLEAMAAGLGMESTAGQQMLIAAVKEASKPIISTYRKKVGSVTGNLGKSMRTLTRKYESAAVAVTGPLQTGTGGATEKSGSGNHAWLVEFGSGPRKPGTQNRRTYINVHTMINRKMSSHSSANDAQFANMSKGFYFLMGSRNEPTRLAKQGSGGDHDFNSWGGKGQRPMTLHPGETYGAMPAQHHMEHTISEVSGEVLASLTAAIKRSIDTLSSRGG